MKRVILITTAALISLTVGAQNNVQNSPNNEKKKYSFLWGIFKSKDYPKNKSIILEAEKPEFSTSALAFSDFDSTRYEQKSILWGAIQWTEKKKNNQPLKSEINER
ncbi:MAG: hypothetical protein ACK57K_09735 [Chryseotalea sp.]|jgi:hypothetical protein